MSTAKVIVELALLLLGLVLRRSVKIMVADEAPSELVSLVSVTRGFVLMSTKLPPWTLPEKVLALVTSSVWMSPLTSQSVLSLGAWPLCSHVPVCEYDRAPPVSPVASSIVPSVLKRMLACGRSPPPGETTEE